MPIHDWSRVDAGIFHDFHHAWIEEIKRALNRVLPKDHYALAEQVAGGFGPDVLTLQRSDMSGVGENPGGLLTLAERQPQVKMRQIGTRDAYARKANRIAVRHVSENRVVAVVEVVSPGNKSSRHGLASFVEKAEALVRGGIHLLTLDLFAAGPRDPNGLHGLIWDVVAGEEFALPAETPLVMASYRADRPPEAFLDLTAVGHALIDMPVFLTTEDYVPLPLEQTYLSAWAAVLEYTQEQVTSAPRT